MKLSFMWIERTFFINDADAYIQIWNIVMYHQWTSPSDELYAASHKLCFTSLLQRSVGLIKLIWILSIWKYSPLHTYLQIKWNLHFPSDLLWIPGSDVFAYIISICWIMLFCMLLTYWIVYPLYVTSTRTVWLNMSRSSSVSI